MRLPRLRFTVRRMIVGVAVVAIVYLMVVIRSTRQMEERIVMEAWCYSSLNNIAIALDGYRKTHGRLPPPFELDQDGKRKHSWRALILPWLQTSNDPITDHYNLGEPWDGVRNISLSHNVPGWLRCPSERNQNPLGSPFVMVNDFGDTPIVQIPKNAILVLETRGINKDWANPHDLIEISPQFDLGVTDHPKRTGRNPQKSVGESGE
jgi:Protein of unknown function (DUF1559)